MDARTGRRGGATSPAPIEVATKGGDDMLSLILAAERARVDLEPLQPALHLDALLSQLARDRRDIAGVRSQQRNQPLPSLHLRLRQRTLPGAGRTRRFALGW